VESTGPFPGASAARSPAPGASPDRSVPSVITRTWSKHEVLRTLDELRDVWRDYAELLNASLDAGALPDEKRTLMEFHRGRFKNAPPPTQQMAELVSLLGDVLELVNHQSVAFRVPTRSALLPEEYNPELARLSRRLRQASAPLESMSVALLPVASLKPVEQRSAGGTAPGSAEDRQAASLRAATASLFKGIVRQDWADVALVMNHINLVTTSGKSPGALHEVGQIARDIYNSLNEFSRDMQIQELTEASQHLPDAVAELNSVIQKLEDFANASLDALEGLTADALDDEQVIAGGLAALEACDRELADVASAHPGAAEEAGRIRTALGEQLSRPLGAIKDRRGQVRDSYMALISNMSFQDLTGQTLNKVIRFIEDLESKLVNLIAQQGPGGQPAAQAASAVPMEGPDPSRGHMPMSQTEVDKTLANLGF